MLTLNQRTYIACLDNEGPQTTRQICESLAGEDNWYTTDMVHSTMRKLEDRGLVRRSETNPIKWELTKLGRKTISIA